MNKKNTLIIIIMTIICCLLETSIELILEPPYFVKSFLKIILFLVIPLITIKVSKIDIFDKKSKLSKKRIFNLLLLGMFIYISMMIAYYICCKYYDFATFVRNIQQDQNINRNLYILVFIYICFCNSLLEEFMFRQIAFLNLKKYFNKTFAYIFSSFGFALYHLSMIGGQVPPLLIIIMMLGLAIGGYIFDLVDSKNNNIYNSWIIHMFADFAIMTIWLIN